MNKTANNRVILLLGLAGFMVTADNWVLSPILPTIAAGLHIQVPTAGLLITAYMVPYGLFQIVFGPLADRYGKKQVITVSMVMFTLTTGLCALGTTLTAVALFRALTGVFAASVIPISFALIGDIFPVEQRQKAIGTFLGIAYLGQGLSMALGGAIATLSSWQGVFITYAGLSLVPTAMLLAAYPKLPSAKTRNARILGPYLDLMANPESRCTFIIIVLESLFIIGSFSYCGSFLARTFHFSAMRIGLVMSGFGVMSVIGGRLSGRLVHGIGAKQALALGLATAALADLLIWREGTSLPAFALAIALLGLGFIFAHSTLVTRAIGFAPKSRGAAMTLVAFCFMGSGGVGTAIGRKIIVAQGLTALFLAYGLGLLATLAASAFLIRDDCPAAKPLVELPDQA
jgi:predicted MFS family arabinose efflux permease